MNTRIATDDVDLDDIPFRTNFTPLMFSGGAAEIDETPRRYFVRTGGRLPSQNAAINEIGDVLVISDSLAAVMSNTGCAISPVYVASDDGEPVSLHFALSEPASYAFGIPVETLDADEAAEAARPEKLSDMLSIWNACFPLRNAQTGHIILSGSSALARGIDDALVGAVVDSDSEARLKAAVQEAKDFVNRHLYKETARASISEDGIVTVQWRNEHGGVLLMFTGDGTATYSVKEPGGRYAGSATEFRLRDGLPRQLRDAIKRVHHR